MKIEKLFPGSPPGGSGIVHWQFDDEPAGQRLSNRGGLASATGCMIVVNAIELHVGIAGRNMLFGTDLAIRAQNRC